MGMGFPWDLSHGICPMGWDRTATISNPMGIPWDKAHSYGNLVGQSSLSWESDVIRVILWKIKITASFFFHFIARP